MSTVQPKVVAQQILVPASDPSFEGGSYHVARATLTNPTTSGFTYNLELYLGVTKVATSGVLTAAIPAGGTITQSFPVVMPLTEAEHEVFLDVWVAGSLIAHYKATENVIITVIPKINVINIIWE